MELLLDLTRLLSCHICESYLYAHMSVIKVVEITGNVAHIYRNMTFAFTPDEELSSKRCVKYKVVFLKESIACVFV